MAADMTTQELLAKIERYEAAIREVTVGHMNEPSPAIALRLVRAAARKVLLDEIKRAQLR